MILCNGVFDCLHIGHLLYLEAAKAIDEDQMLLVALTADSTVHKGPGRPVFPWEERYRMLRALRCVDNVVICWGGPEVVRDYRPAIYVKGKDWEGKLPEQAFVESYGGRVVFIDTPKYSSTKILTGELLNERIRADRERQT